ncbi:hypothetical protein L7F22_064795 [Adiantum nelumboides]|nr:hypothetical protein [Adiantum nelumboides]
MQESTSLLKSNAMIGADIGEKLPIRLRDVIDTISSHHRGNNIVFIKGSSRGWDIHIVSHTWSKGVIRDLSEEIGKHIINEGHQLAGHEPMMEADAYSHAFKEADFSNVSSYHELRLFLRLLAGDGAKHIWFDALCIDQTNMEKSREIGNMGAYYRRSQGCYVLTHGVGEGYQLWGKKGPRGFELPRWFSRVWTLQEFLLPRRLSFFVEALDPRFLVFVNMLARAKYKSGLCRCFCELPRAEEYEFVKLICDANDEVDLSWAV